MSPSVPSPVSTAALFRVFGTIGLLSFGGPAGQIALMHRMLVDERKWLDEDQFLHALNFCMLLPGPEAMQLATYAGWLKRGTFGGLVAGLLFVLPGFVVLLALSAIYLRFGTMPLVKGLLFGLSAAVLAVVVEAILRVAKRALKTRFHMGLAITAFFAIAFLKVPFPLIIAAAALAGWARHKMTAAPLSATAPAIQIPVRQTLTTILIWGAVWLIPLAALVLGLGKGNVFADQALFFSKAALVTFGGAYAVLAYVGEQAVSVYGWLQPQEMVTGLGLAETTPGPLILVLVFVGTLGGARLSGFDPLTGGLFGGITALWFTFAPCFLWIFAGAPHVERLRGIAALSAALSGVTAAVVGVITNLALWFGLHVMFGAVGAVQFGPLHLPGIDVTTLDWRALIIAIAAALLLLRFHVNLIAVLVLAALGGWLLVG
jgi:chromate transporter